MAFTPGKSGNKKGRPLGIPDKRTQYRSLLEPHAKELIQILIDKAKQGDPLALKLCIERLIPKPKDSMVEIALPREINRDSLRLMSEKVLRDLEAQHITPNQAKDLFDVIKGYRDNIFAVDLHEDYKNLWRIMEDARRDVLPVTKLLKDQ